MYTIYQKGRLVWGIGMTPKSVIENALDLGARFEPQELSLFPSNSILDGAFCQRPCSTKFWSWFITTLYPEDEVWTEDSRGRVILKEEEEERSEFKRLLVQELERIGLERLLESYSDVYDILANRFFNLIVRKMKEGEEREDGVSKEYFEKMKEDGGAFECDWCSKKMSSYQEEWVKAETEYGYFCIFCSEGCKEALLEEEKMCKEETQLSVNLKE